jgi:ribosomal protein S14
MVNFSKKQKKNFFDNKQRLCFVEFEIFSNSGKILKQAKFSSKLSRFSFFKQTSGFFATTFRNRCVFSGKPRSVFSKFKMSRIVFEKKILSGNVTGFFRSI